MASGKALKKTKRNSSRGKGKTPSPSLRKAKTSGSLSDKTEVQKKSTSKGGQFVKTGFCPECLTQVEGSLVQLSPRNDPKSPWRQVLKAYRCSQCEFLIPAHIWELWKELPIQKAVKEWTVSFRPKSTREVDQSLMNEFVNSVFFDGPLSKKANVEYVDEEGNPVDISGRDMDSLEFCDEFGRTTDHLGNLTETLLSEPEAVLVGEKLLGGGKAFDVVGHCTQYLGHYPNNAALWRVLGCGHGSVGNAKAARIAFLSALKLDPTDGLTLSNYFTACFDTGDKKSGIEGIEQFFDDLDLVAQKIVLGSLIEALKTGLVQSHDLPASIKKLIK